MSLPLTVAGVLLAQMIFTFGKHHLDYLVAEFVEHCNTRRAHMERDNLPPVRDVPEQVATRTMDQIEMSSYVGGPDKSFARKTA